MAWRGTTHSNGIASFIGLAGATTSAGHNPFLRVPRGTLRSRARRMGRSEQFPFCHAAEVWPYGASTFGGGCMGNVSSKATC